jgi:hypothetical protein
MQWHERTDDKGGITPLFPNGWNGNKVSPYARLFAFALFSKCFQNQQSAGRVSLIPTEPEVKKRPYRNKFIPP